MEWLDPSWQGHKSYLTLRFWLFAIFPFKHCWIVHRQDPLSVVAVGRDKLFRVHGQAGVPKLVLLRVKSLLFVAAFFLHDYKWMAGAAASLCPASGEHLHLSIPQKWRCRQHVLTLLSESLSDLCSVCFTYTMAPALYWIVLLFRSETLARFSSGTVNSSRTLLRLSA